MSAENDVNAAKPQGGKSGPNHLFDSIEINPSAHNFGTLTGRTRPTLTNLSMGNIEKHFEHSGHGSARNVMRESADLDAMLEDQELNENERAMDNKEKKTKEKVQPRKFGTFDGVLARCLLCIWGVIMYLRTGWIVGQAGIWQTCIIMLLSASVTFFTSLSLSAICTNGEVKSGGYYFLISRSLGPEFGGVIGILFALANCISVAMYLAGFSETIVAQYDPPLTGSEKWDIVLWAEIVLTLIFMLALRGVGGIIKFDMVLLVVLVISIIVYFIGTFGVTKPDPEGLGYTGYSSQTFASNWNPDYINDQKFITVFSVFFPAVTGEMAGANISGDLKTPSYSIPVGTLSAIVISTIVYLGIAVSLGSCVLRTVGDSKTKGLIYDFQIMPKISAWAPLVIVGIFASTLSSGMSCFVGAPRIFQAVCQDRLFPPLTYFAKGREKDGEPVRAYFIVYLLCFLSILTGDINVIAPLITNFFLITYAVMNYSTFTWSLTRSPGWRPTFKWYNKWVSLLASAECIVLMFLIDWITALITVVIGVIMYKYIAFTEPDVNWGTAAEAITYVETCNKLLKYQAIKAHAKIERPKFLIFNRSTEHVQQMYGLASIMNEKFRGMTMIGDIIIGHHKDHHITNKYVQRARNHKYKDIPVEISKNSLIQSCIAPTFVDGVRTIIQTAGVGAIKPNVALFNVKDYTSATIIKLKPAASPDQTPQQIQDSPASMQTAISAASAADKPATMTLAPSINEDQEEPAAELSPPNPSLNGQEEQEQEEQDGFQAPDYVDGLQDALLTGMGVMLVAGPNYMDWTTKRSGYIDIWWLYDDGGLTVLIPYLLTSHPLWKDCKLRIMALENLGYSEQNELAALMTKLRIDAEIVPVRSETAFGGKIEITDGNTDSTGTRNEGSSLIPTETPLQTPLPNEVIASPAKPSQGVKGIKNYAKTPQDDVDADFPLVEDDMDQKKGGLDGDDDPDMQEDIDLTNTLFSGSKLMKSSYVDNYHKSLRHEVFTYDDITDLNPDNNVNVSANAKSSDEEKDGFQQRRMKKEMESIFKDEKLSQYAKRKLAKYATLGRLIERSRDSDLCIVTMPFPRAQYTSYEYMKILQSLSPNSMNNLIFVRGNQDQVLTFAL
eukprot:CAMPEP_0197031262 /NCGR_PEP_ID=MMETSP1384-20130603/10322_1 /TAXON_ID=29189 /ORGANISM="Ammonia sp." /LENGTH=1120 /DNA_ID=CAMNT_0042460769 /DNA_START=114 /DNA_END=3476 /DNA_ORIENTATION=+